jgi:hypothetical protein
VKGVSVFSRLGDQEANYEEKNQKKPEIKHIEVQAGPPKIAVTLKLKKEMTSSSDEEYGPKPPVPKMEKHEKSSIFARLDKVRFFKGNNCARNEQII